MSLLIEGTKGLIQAGPSGAPTTVAFVTDFTVDCKTAFAQRGPYIGNNVILKTRQAKTSQGSLVCDVPQGADGGQNAVVAAHEAGTNLRLVLQGGDTSTQKGYTYTAANAGISAVKFVEKSKEGVTLDISFEDLDGYTLVPTP